jgi:hypothetical protein
MGMAKAWQVIIGCLLVIGFVSAGFALFYGFDVSSSPDAGGECNVLKEGKGYNVLFFSAKADAEKYYSLLLNSEAFARHKEEFRISYIDNYKPECSYYKDIALFCYSRDLVKRAASCSTDFIVVIKEDNIKYRSSAYMNVVSIVRGHSTNVLLHEFGHVFADLADEYVPAVLPRTSKNCLANCNLFREAGAGCYKGCSEDSMQRSIEKGVMRTLATSDFGIYNDNLISGYFRTEAPVTGMASSTPDNCADEDYVLIEGYYSNGKIEIKNKESEKGCAGTNGRGPFSYKLILKDGSLFEGEFNPEIIFSDLPADDGQLSGGSEKYRGEFTIKVPYVKDMNKLQIKSGEELMTEVNVDDSRPCKL